MDVESVRSGRSDHSGRYVIHPGSSSASPSHRYVAAPSRPPPPPPTHDRESEPADGSSAVDAPPLPPQPPPRNGHSHHGHRSKDHAHHQQHRAAPRADVEVELDSTQRDLLRGDEDADDVGGLTSGPGEAPDEDAWMETNTAITTGTSAITFSEAGFSSVENMSRLNKSLEQSIGFACARYAGTVVSGVIGLLAYLSPIVMIILPQTGIIPNITSSEDGGSDCGADCEGLLIGFAFKEVILLAGSWALFIRRPRATLPRVSVFRALIVLFVFILTVAFWLFYGVRLLSETGQTYTQLVQFGISMTDTLLFTHYVAVVMLELRPLQSFYVVKLVRSPDGMARSYTVGLLSVQRLALHCLDHYYRDFEVYNPYLEHAATRRSTRMTDFKVYNLDPGATSDTALSGGGAGGGSATGVVVARAGSIRSGSRGHNDRFYDEVDYERKLRKRRARLSVAAEEAFNHVTQLHSSKGSAVELSPMDAAQAIFPGIARPLQKFLRTTRQQPRYTGESILDHLAQCIGHGLGARAFLETYLTQGAVIWNDKDCGPSSDAHTWTIVCASSLSSGIGDGTMFRIQRGNVMLFATVRKLPHFNLTEDVFSPKNNKFSLQMSSETSV